MHHSSPRTRMRAMLSLSVATLLAAGLLGCAPGGDGGAAESSACAGPEVGDDGLKPVRIAYLGGLGTLPIRIAATHGFFEENGIKPELTQAASNTDFIPGLCRQYDVVNLAPSDLLLGKSQGADVGVLAGLVNSAADNPNAPFVSLPETGPIETLDDIVGKNIGVVTLTGYSALSIKKLLSDAGLPEDAVTFTTMAFPNMADQLAAGAIDAAIMPSPFWVVAEKQGLVIGSDPLILATGDPALVVFDGSSRGWVDANPETAAAYYRAREQAIEWIADNLPEALAEAGEWLELPEGLLTGIDTPPLNAEVTESMLATWVDLMLATGNIDESIDPKELILYQP